MKTNYHSNKRRLTSCLLSFKCPHLVNRNQNPPLQTLAHPARSPASQKYRIQVPSCQTQTVILAVPARVLNSINPMPPQLKLSLHPRLRHNHLHIHHLQRNTTHPPIRQQPLHLTLSIRRTSPLPRATPLQPPPKTTQLKAHTSRTLTPMPPTHPRSLDLTVGLLCSRVIRSGSSLSLFRTISLICSQAESLNDLQMM